MADLEQLLATLFLPDADRHFKEICLRTGGREVNGKPIPSDLHAFLDQAFLEMEQRINMRTDTAMRANHSSWVLCLSLIVILSAIVSATSGYTCTDLYLIKQHIYGTS